MQVVSTSQSAAQKPATPSSSEDYCAFRTPGCFSVGVRPSLNCVLQGLNHRGLYLKTSIRPEIGDEVDAVFEKIGRLRGATEEITEDGVFVGMPPALMSGLLDQVAWLTTAECQRRHLRLHPRDPNTSIRVNGGHVSHAATILDFSLSGASLHTEAPTQMGDSLTFPNLTHGKVVWIGGDRRLGVEFQRAFRPTEFSWNTKL